MSALAKKEATDGVEESGGEEHDHDEGEGEGIAGDFFEAVEDLDGGDAGDIEDEGDAEFGEGEDEDDGGASEEAWHDQGESDFAKDAEAGGAEVLGGFVHGWIEVGEGGGEIEEEDGVEVEGVEGDDAVEAAIAEPVDGLGGG